MCVVQTRHASCERTIWPSCSGLSRLGTVNPTKLSSQWPRRPLESRGDPFQVVARERLDIALALAQDTGMCFYDTELLRLRAQTHADPAARQVDINAALELARRQGATLFELRAALDDFELRGEPASAAVADAAKRIPADNAWPELARAQAAHSEQSQRI